MQVGLVEDRVTVVEVKATAIEVVVGAVKEEVAQAIVQYKASLKFEDKISKVVYNDFYKGFEECKKKVAQAFNILDLDDIIVDEPERAKGGTDSSV